MAESANVLSIERIREFRNAVQRFLEELSRSLDSIKLELQRAFDWIEHDRPNYWKAQTRRAFERVAETRTALSTCLMRTVAGRRPSCIEEKQAHEAAKRRLQHCQNQIERTKQWGYKIRHEANDFRGRMAGLQRLTESDLPRLLALLDRTVAALENYAEIVSAEGDPPGKPASSGDDDVQASDASS